MSDLPRIDVYLWFCGDDECDCTQPVVERLDPNPRAPGFITRTRLWEGSFRSQADRAERAQQLRELRSAARRFGVTLSRDSRSGYRLLNAQERAGAAAGTPPP